jgi:hypothetical protein
MKCAQWTGKCDGLLTSEALREQRPHRRGTRSRQQRQHSLDARSQEHVCQRGRLVVVGNGGKAPRKRPKRGGDGVADGARHAEPALQRRRPHILHLALAAQLQRRQHLQHILYQPVAETSANNNSQQNDYGE